MPLVQLGMIEKGVFGQNCGICVWCTDMKIMGIVPMIGWFLQLCVWLLQTVKCQKWHNQLNHFHQVLKILGLHINKKMSKSPEFGPVT